MPVPNSDQTLSRDHLLELVAGTSDAIVAVSQEPRILLFNRGAEALFGFSAAETLGAALGLLFPPETRRRIQQHAKATPSQAAPTLFRVRCRCRDGKELEAEASLSCLPVEGDRLQLLILRRVAETSRRRPLESGFEAQGDIGVEERLRQSTHLPSGIGHDFNNLFAVVLGSLELLEDHVGGNREAMVLLERALRGTEMGVKLTQRLMAIARHHDLRPSGTDIGKLINSQIGTLTALLGDGIEVDTRIGNHLSNCSTDPVRLAAALQHLALNAREAMPNGGRFEIEATKEIDDEGVVLTVADNGEGISGLVLQDVCKPSFTTKQSDTHKGSGLSYTYDLVRRSGGEMEIESAPGQGTRVTLRLPRADGQPAVDTAERETKRILIVEDDVNVRDYAVTALHDLGYSTLAVGTAHEALDILEKVPDIDLLFSDILLPGGMSGVELTHQVEAKWPDLKILLTSGYAKDVLGQQRKLRREISIIEKPYLMIELAMMLAEIFEKGQE